MTANGNGETGKEKPINIPDIRTVPEHALISDIRKQDKIITLLDLSFGALLGLLVLFIYLKIVGLF